MPSGCSNVWTWTFRCLCRQCEDRVVGRRRLNTVLAYFTSGGLPITKFWNYSIKSRAGKKQYPLKTSFLAITWAYFGRSQDSQTFRKHHDESSQTREGLFFKLGKLSFFAIGKNRKLFHKSHFCDR
mmetsp:Transcript_3713/g.7796  ORF Transcript_3713/g.7796 Transcript_3713/m.7796 type:complete len:126 (+) Transcript_3713:1386-1763(+)